MQSTLLLFGIPAELNMPTAMTAALRPFVVASLDLARTQHAIAARNGVIQTSILESARFEQSLTNIERLLLAQHARTV